ncbi:N-terminal domain of NEFA-interacting nuclear protein NIP30-domain-containing protein, partial [Microdochium bolleyi]
MSSRFVSGGTILTGSDGSTKQLLPSAGSSSASGGGDGDTAPAPAPAAAVAGTTLSRTAPPAAQVPRQTQQSPAAAAAPPHPSQEDEPSSSSSTTTAGPAAETDPAALARQAEWAAVQASLDRERREREAHRRAVATGEGAEKTLYAILQENKAAKQAAFEEANKIRNQFPTLDDDEIEFLDGVADGKRLEEE